MPKVGAAALEHMDDPADHAPVVPPFDTAHTRRQMRFDPLPLPIAQPKQVLAHDPALQTNQMSGPGVWGNQSSWSLIPGGVMGQILHGSATTTHAIRAAIQRSKAPLKELAAQYGLNQKTVAKWRKRAFVHDAAMGPKAPHSTVLSAEEEAIVVAFRKHTLLPLDDCLYALQATLPHLPAHHKSWDGLRCPTIALLNIKNIVPLKSEERRVGKECRSR